jgi:hypothetical protein
VHMEIWKWGCSSLYQANANKHLICCSESRLIVNVYFPFPNLGHDIPLRTIGDVIRYIILWPYKLTSLNYM